MKLVKNWKRIALKSHSMWATYAGIAFLVVPEVTFALTGFDHNPYLTGYAGIALLIYGGLGRIIDQGIHDA